MPYTIYTAPKKNGAEPTPLFHSPNSDSLYDAVLDAIANQSPLHNADLSGLTLFGDLSGLQADGALLSKFDARGFAIKECSFRCAKLDGNWSGSLVSHCDFAVSTIAGDMTLAKIEHCSFWGSMVAGLDITGSTQHELDFSGAFTNSSESIKGLLPEQSPDVHRKMMRFDSDISLRGMPGGMDYYHRLLVQMPLKLPSNEVVSICADVEWSNDIVTPFELNGEPLATATLQVRSSEKVVKLIADACGAEDKERISITAFIAAGAKFITNYEPLRLKLQELSAEQMVQQYELVAHAISFLEPLTQGNALSKQTQLKTGDAFGALSYRNALSQSDSVSPAGLIEHVKTGALMYVPLASSAHEQAPGWELSTLSNLMSAGGRGGFDWGNTSGSDGGFGKERLQSMIDAGLVTRTGGTSPNQLGGSWPEVELTPAGAAVALAYQQQAPTLSWVGVPLVKPDKEKATELRPKMA